MTYEESVANEVAQWKAEMQKPPSLLSTLSKDIQTRINNVIPEKVHQAITAAIKQMVRGVILGAELGNPVLPAGLHLQVRESMVRDRIRFYRNTATAEGAVTGAGGFLLGLADFPLWLALKMKMMYEVASLYGADIRDYKERVYLLHIFQLTFSSQKNRNKIFSIIQDWQRHREMLPDNIHEFDWRTFQLEYRDYIDLAKLLQLVPGVGAVVGAYVNHRLTERLGENTMNAYRIRWGGPGSASPHALT